MAPKKGRKRGSTDVATPAQSVGNLGTLNGKAAGLVQQLYDRRFDEEGSENPLSWPLLHGGTFVEVAQRAWADDGVKLIDQSFKFLIKVGAIEETMTLDQFVSTFLEMKVWPPEPGSTFETNILNWSMGHDSFWKGFVPNSEVLALALGIAQTRLREGEVLGMRLPEKVPESGGKHSLLFDDGSQKGLGAFIAWCCLISMEETVSKDDLDVQGKNLIDSLMKIPTMFKTKATLSRADNIIANVAKQDGDSRVQPVSSFTWSSILKSLSTTGSSINFHEAIQKYNQHPDVLSFHKGEEAAIDKKKTQAIRNWLEACGDGARKVVEQSQHTIPFSMGPFGEQLSQMNFLFNKSTVSIQPESESLAPLEKEQSMSVDWQLPLDDCGQEMLFKHICNRFSVDSAVVPLEKKKKYRAQADVLLPYRNCCAFFSQIKAFLLTKLSGDEVSAMQDMLESYQGCQDIQHILAHRPEVFAISMLPSKKAQAQKQEEEKEQRKTMNLESKRVEVQASQWAFFCEALSNDQEKISVVQKAPKKIREIQHLKAVQHRKSQESKAVQAVEGYMQNSIRILDTKNTAETVKETSDFARFIAGKCGCNFEDVTILGFIDYNAPHARGSESSQALAKTAAALNSINKTKNATLLLLPDLPRSSCARGLADEEAQIQANLWSQMQHVDTRWIHTFEVENNASGMSQLRRWTSGRIAVHADSYNDNKWVTDSELAVAGRPLFCYGKEHVMPRTTQVVIPENLSADDDLKLAERKRPGKETMMAQKGVGNYMSILISCMKGLTFGKQAPLLLVNLTGYIEDMAIVAMNYNDGQVEHLDKYPVEKSNLFYLSCHTLDGSDFGKARVCRTLTDKWLNNEMSFAGLKFDPAVPEVNEQELKQIPGYEAVLQSADKLEFEVLVRRGTSFIINPDEERKWSSLATTSEQFEQLKNNHQCRFKDALASVVKVGPSSSTVAAPAATPQAQPSVEDDDEGDQSQQQQDGTTPRQFDSVEELKGSTKIIHEVASDIPGVKILITENAQVILLSDTPRQLSKGQQLGGFGSGQYVPSASGVPGLALAYDSGDKTKVQIEESSIRRDSTATPVMTLYQLLVLVERTFKVTAHKVSYTEVERAADDSGRDTFKVKLTKSMVFKFLDDDRDGGGEAPAKRAKKNVTGKSVFRYSLDALGKSPFIQSVFRYRFEKIGQTLKLMKPYVVLCQNIKLEAKKPLEVAAK